jgi:hypothetical protein
MGDQTSVVELLHAYREVLLKMHERRVETGAAPRGWNRLVDRLQELQLVLRDSEAGRAGITALVADSNATVRQWAAAHALFWDEPIARAELEAVATGARGLDRLTAEMTLREFDAGRLRMDWVPGAK